MKNIVVEYSKTQGCFHIDTLDEVIKTNCVMFLKGVSNDYQIIGIYDTYEQGNAAIRRFEQKLRYDPKVSELIKQTTKALK